MKKGTFEAAYNIHLRNAKYITKFQPGYLKRISNLGDLSVGWRIILKIKIAALGCSLLYSALDGDQ
jgi:hypothetical protein